jgi:hypothetical protein
MLKSLLCGLPCQRSLVLVLCLFLIGGPGIGSRGEATSSRTAGDDVLLSNVDPATGKLSPTGLSSEASGSGVIGLNQRDRVGKNPSDAAPDKHQLLIMLLTLRSTEGRYPFIVLR